MTYDHNLVLDEADNVTPAHRARATALLQKGLHPMPKPKPKTRKPVRKPALAIGDHTIAVLVHILKTNRHLTAIQTKTLADLISTMKD